MLICLIDTGLLIKQGPGWDFIDFCIGVNAWSEAIFAISGAGFLYRQHKSVTEAESSNKFLPKW